MKLQFSDLDAILFDFDGVVVLSEHVYDSATQELARQLKISIPAEFMERMRGQSDRLFFESVVNEFQPEAPMEEVVALGRKLLLEAFASSIHHNEGYLEFREQIDKLGLQSALVTSTPRKLLDYILGNSDLQVVFKEIITADDVQKLKPDPEPYRSMCERLGVAPERAMVIEDSPAGVRSGRSAGCFVTAITTSSKADSLSHADFVVDSFTELSELLA